MPPKYFWYYDSDNFTDTPTYDPWDCECIICLTKMNLDDEDIKLIDWLIRDEEKWRWYFFRIHNSCWDSLSEYSQQLYINSLMKNLDFKDVELIKNKDDININIEKSKINLITKNMLDWLMEKISLSDIREKYNIWWVLHPTKRTVIIFNDIKDTLKKHLEIRAKGIWFKIIFTE